MKAVLILVIFLFSICSFADANRSCGKVISIRKLSKYQGFFGNGAIHFENITVILNNDQEGSLAVRSFSKDSFNGNDLYKQAKSFAMQAIGNDNVKLCLLEQDVKKGLKAEKKVVDIYLLSKEIDLNF